MKYVFKNVGLIIIALVLSKITASFFGSVYHQFVPLNDGSLLGLGNEALEFIAGFPFAYIFFTILLLKVFAEGNKKKWTGWLVAPAALFFAMGDLKYIYLPIILGAIAWGLAKLVQKILVKIKLQ